jgi:hypothetical protein
MVALAQLVEPRIVIPVVTGSNPVRHPMFIVPVAQLAELRFPTPTVGGSIPSWDAKSHSP